MHADRAAPVAVAMLQALTAIRVDRRLLIGKQLRQDMRGLHRLSTKGGSRRWPA
jgi:hypothetical protein